jgi:VanZ family protein
VAHIKEVVLLKKIRWGIFLFWVCLTVFLCLQDGRSSGELSSFIAGIIHADENVLRKFAHFFVHFVLAFLAYQAITVSVKKKSTAVLCTVLLSLIFAVTDEFFQTVVIDRSAELRDVIINMSGVFSGTFIGFLFAEKSS